MPTRRIALYGKGGSGKSTVTSNLAIQYAARDLRLLQIGCDPKRDSTVALMQGRQIPSVISLMQGKRLSQLTREEFVFTGLGGVSCIESGGPEPGVGCAGRGIVNALKLIRAHGLLEAHEVVLFDVLGDVVCGGFAVPLMGGVASTVAIVVADNLMSMYAANNIARAVRRFERNGTHLAGLIANNVHRPQGAEELAAFAERIGTPLLAVIPHDKRILDAERERRILSAWEPEAAASRVFAGLADALLAVKREACSTPTPMDDTELDAFFRAVSR